MSRVTGVGKPELGVQFLVVRKKDGTTQSWAECLLEASAQKIADERNAARDGWTYEVMRTRT